MAPLLLHRCQSTRPSVVFPGPFPAGCGATLAGLGLVVSLLSGDLRAAELNLVDLNRYGARAQVTSAASFSDVRPTDWAYQALANLVDRDGCVAGYPNATFRGGGTISRDEAAALLQACLDRVQDRTDELRSLSKEFQAELAQLRGRVDGLGSRVGRLVADQFSTTTTLSGVATSVVGANAFGGSARDLVGSNRREWGGTSFLYDLQLSLDTSFTGKDLLRTVLRDGNFGKSPFGGGGPTGQLSLLEVAFDQECRDFACPFVVSVDRLFYQVPIGANLTATFGARVEQDDMLAQVPSVYPDDTLLNVMTLAGAPGAYNNNLGSGAGLWWKDRGWSLSANYVALDGDNSDPRVGGIGTAGGQGSGTLQLGYSQEAWGLAAIYSWVQGGFEITGATPQASLAFSNGSHTDAFGLSGFWQPSANGWIPSISVGWGLNSTAYGDDPSPTAVTTSQSWMVGMQWKDAFVKDNTLGFGIGQPIFATALRDGSTPNDGNVVLEGWYRVQLTDHISLMPALFYLNRPLGQDTPASRRFHQLGGLMKTSFHF